MYHSKILVSWLSSKSAYPELAYIIVYIKRSSDGDLFFAVKKKKAEPCDSAL